MPIQDTDLFLIESGGGGPIIAGKSFKITASKLKAGLAANEYFNYKLLVNKPDYTSKFVLTQNMQQSVALTDYMMVERDGVSYKVTGQQLIDYFPSVPAGAAGPILGVSPTQLVLDADTNLDQFSNGDAIHMVDNTGEPASYTPQTNAVSSVVTTVTYDLSIESQYFTQNPPVNLCNGTGGQVETTKRTDGSMNAAWGFGRENGLPGGSFSMYISNGSSSSYKSARITMSSNGNGDYRQDFTIGPGQYYTFNSGFPNVYWFWIIVYNPLNEQVIVGDFKGGGQLINLPQNVPELQFSSGNSDLIYFQKNDIVTTGHKVVDVDTVNNKMILSGGNWPVGSTVTGPANSGTGNFGSYSGTNVAITNSNNQWIGSDNRLGEEFFIKNNSSRIGLGTLRTKAIAQAQAWVADAGYLEKAVVTHNGRYWYAVSSNYANSPDETDTKDWVDLGPVESSAPFAIDGYYPLYSTADEADAASSSDSHHVHTLNGVTYYMPNGGTIYHGDYTG